MKKLIAFCLAGFVVTYVITSCKHSSPAPDGNLPPEVASILLNKCAVSGCHNQASYGNADSLLTDTWDHLFDGSTNGAVVVPYSPLYSSLLYFCNTDPSLGVVAVPTMPSASSPLTKDEYMTLYNWILNGAPDKNGNIPFASNPDTRQKFYLTNQGCDLMAVIDAQKKVVMRYIPIGNSGPFSSPGVLSPHCVRVSPDGLTAYTSFLAGGHEQMIDTRTDQVTGGVDISIQSFLSEGAGSWNIVFVSPNGKELATSDWEASGVLSFMDASTMQVEPGQTYTTASLSWPHGIASDAIFDSIFVTGQYGNTIYKFVRSIADSGLYPITAYSLDGKTPQTSSTNGTGINSNSPDPHEILMTPDYSKYFVTCQGINQVVVMDAHSQSPLNAILATIPVGIFPQELAISKKYPYMFVTCMEDNSTYPGGKGSVYVINYNTYEIVDKIYGDFYQPHGIAVDDNDGLLMIASANINPDGPAPHHVTTCGGRDGWYTFYDLNSGPKFKPASNRRYEVTVYPYSAAVRFKQ